MLSNAVKFKTVGVPTVLEAPLFEVSVHLKENESLLSVRDTKVAVAVPVEFSVGVPHCPMTEANCATADPCDRFTAVTLT